MCGIVAYCGATSRERRGTFRQLCCEATIRGLHAFGIAYYYGGRVRVFKSLSFVEVMNAIPNPLPERIVFHNRYCTSGDFTVMNNNQPLVVDGNALAFNGVVDMGTKAEMERRHSTLLTTENDGELVLQDIRRGDPFRSIANRISSFAGVYLGKDGEMFALRNEMRPLWSYDVKDGTFIVSTVDIARRAVPDLDMGNIRQIDAYEIMRL